MQRSEQGLFDALEAELKRASEPLDCATLFDRPSIRAHAQTVNRVSDYLGGLWRRGLLTRIPSAPQRGSRARWAYSWKNKDKTLSDGLPLRATPVLTKPTVEITDNGGVITISLPQLTIVIRPKP